VTVTEIDNGASAVSEYDAAGRLVSGRHTEPEKDHQLLLAQLGWELPSQSKPRITAKREMEM